MINTILLKIIIIAPKIIFFLIIFVITFTIIVNKLGTEYYVFVLSIIFYSRIKVVYQSLLFNITTILNRNVANSIHLL